MVNIISSKYTLTGMDCPGCAATIEKYCKKISGVEKAEVNYASSTLKIECNSSETKQKLEKGIHNLGYTLKEMHIETEKSSIYAISTETQKNVINQKIKDKFKKNNHLHTSAQKNTLQTPIKSEVNKSPILANESQKNELTKIFIPIVILAAIFIICSLFKSFSPKIGTVLFDILTLFCLYPILRKIIQYFKVKFYFSVEFLMAIAVVGALFIHAAQEAAMVMILFKLGEALEGYTSKKASKGIEKLSSLIPDYANVVLENNQVIQVKVSEILQNQVLLIKPSERFPADGILLEGETYIDESLLTGESTPIHKKVAQKVYAGSLNTASSVKILTTQVGSEHSVARLVQLVQDAQWSKSKTLRTIENFSKYYTPSILLLGLFTAILPPLLGLEAWQTSIYKGLAILLIGCPCALIISTPSAIAAGISAASRLGILIKNASALEIIGRVKTIAFDKTGTLTLGKLDVTDVISLSTDFSENEILRLATSLEQHSTHPLAKSILVFAKDKQIESYLVKNAKTISGVGISADINHKTFYIFSPCYAFENNYIPQEKTHLIETLQQQGKTVCILTVEFANEIKSIGLIALQDKLKEGVKFALDNLKSLKINPIILTGDHKKNTEMFASSLDVKIMSQLLPEQKLAYIRQFSQAGKVAMVGDGINDAPALTAADVGVAMGEGTDIAVDSAQIVIANKNISSLIFAVKISRKTLNIIIQNIIISILLKLLFLYLTFMGDTRLWMAILADTGATVLVTLNSMRLLNYKR